MLKLERDEAWMREPITFCANFNRLHLIRFSSNRENEAAAPILEYVNMSQLPLA